MSAHPKMTGLTSLFKENPKMPVGYEAAGISGWSTGAVGYYQ